MGKAIKTFITRPFTATIQHKPTCQGAWEAIDEVKLPVRKHRAGLWTRQLAVMIFIESVDRMDMNAFVVKTMHRLGLLPGVISIARGVVRIAFQRGRVGTLFVPTGCP